MMLLVACILFRPIPTVRAEADADTHHAKKKTVTMLTPPSNFYPVYIADPVRPQSAIKLFYFPDSEIPDVGPGRLSLYRIAAEAGTGRSVMGEFFFRDETNVGIGWYFDF
jgi:hypothetical protein